MGFTQPDTPPERPGQMPAAPDSGPAPVPYTGTDQQPEPPEYSVPALDPLTPDGAVLASTDGANHVMSSPLAAPNQNPYEAGSPDPIYVGGDADAGGRDIVAGSVAEAVHNAEARFGELQGDTYGQGSHIGDVWTLPPSPLDPGVGSLGEALPTGAYYDPDRRY